ncbi:hypothetical protein [Sulfurimonas sp.]|uniref:hypothetical protein n=1 Tax=Sulfurimonas sp. TaxID=2022749 RepID=UPI0025EF9A83|nr:hypothetical protein [Sulfurimonas sp.]MDD5157353.1 hypothetical protein [Sulfurimonas sp.]
MKRVKFKIILVLLLSFSFLVAHDYVVQDKNYDTNYEICCSKHTSTNIGATFQIHDNIHTILSVPIISELKIVFISKKKELFFFRDSLASISKLVLQRPPIN